MCFCLTHAHVLHTACFASQFLCVCIRWCVQTCPLTHLPSHSPTQIMTLCHLEGPRYLLGYMAREDRVFLMDKQRQIVSYKLLLSVLQYQVGGQTCMGAVRGG